MIRRQSLSAYTPSNTDPEILQRIFVQREELLSLIVKRFCNSVTTGDMYHALLVGPRGSGKTHFVSLVEWELRQRNELANKLRICWLGEDDSFTALIYLAFGIARQLAVAYPKEFPADFKDAVRGLPQQDAALAILRNVMSNLGDRTLLLITENLDQTFPSLGKNGRAAWRAFLQENRCIAMLATSQLLFDDVSKRDEAFFGFFDIHHLESLSVNDAHELIRRISIEQKKRELINYLSTAEGRYRVRALHYLAGGNHRMYVLLSEFLTRDTLDSLVNAFEDLAEEMTPYFQERMRALPDQQRQIAQCLCDAEGAITVKSIAGETFIDERTVSKQLSNLKTRRYVCSVKRGKESYYDMAEPLMRLCLEVKNQRGEPLRMVVRFLKAWFPESALTTKGEITKVDARVDAYSQMAVLTNSAFNDAIAQTINKEISSKIYEGSLAEAFALTRELQFANRPGALLREAQLAELQGGGFEHALTKYTAVIEMAEAPVEQRAIAQCNRGVAYGQQGKIALELADYTAVIEMAEAPVEQRAIAQRYRGVAYGQQGEIALALADFTAVIEMAEAPVEQRAIAQRYRGVAYGQQGEIALELADYTAVIEMAEAPVEERAIAQRYRGVAYGQQGEIALELADYTAVIEMAEAPVEERAIAQRYRGVAYGQQGEIALALADFTAVIEMAEAPVEQRAIAQRYRGVTYGQQGKIALALADFTAVIEMAEAPVEQRAIAQRYRGVAYGQQGEIALALADYTAVIEMAEAPVEQRAIAQRYRGVAYGQQGEIALELADYTAVIEMAEAPVEQRAIAQCYRGVTYGQQGKIALALADFTAVIEMAEAPVEQRAIAQRYRGVAYGQQGEIALALADFTAVIEMAEAPVEQRAIAQRYRGVAYGQQGEIALELADYTAVIEMAEAPVEQRAIAQCYRGVTYGQQGEIALALADYTAVIEMAEAPVEQRAIAQCNRGVAYGQQGEIALELADYTAVIEMAEAPVEQRADALHNRGTAYWQVEQFESAAEDFKAVLSTNESGVSDNKHVIALFNLVEPLIAIDTFEEVLKTLDRAMSLRRKYDLEFAGTPKDILSMVLKRPKFEWSNYCSRIAMRYIENDLVDQFGQGLTRSIELLDKGDFTAAARCEWVSIWRAVGDPYDGLSIPLQCLDAAVAVMNSDPPSDVPLLGLPPEMRTLVRPMLNTTLGEDYGG